MEAEARAILVEAVREPVDSAGLFTTLLDRFGALGGVDLDLPGREERRGPRISPHDHPRHERGSELMRPEPAPGVASWVRDRDRRELRTTAITLAESGTALPGCQTDVGSRSFSSWPTRSSRSSDQCNDASSRERAGKPIAGFDALIAAVCRSQGAALATRNVSDFDGTGIEIVDPWLQ